MAKQRSDPDDVDSDTRRRRAPCGDARTVITPLLEPGEKLLWYANGRGPHWIPYNIYSVIVLSTVSPIATATLILHFLEGKLSVAVLSLGLALIAVVTLLLVAGLVLAIFSPSRDCYGLTDRRVIVVWRSWVGRTRSYSATNISAFRLRDGKTGDIAFWKPPVRRVNRAWAIVGIDEPRRVAELIKATLQIDLPLEVVNPALHIPPLKPRTP